MDLEPYAGAVGCVVGDDRRWTRCVVVAELTRAHRLAFGCLRRDVQHQHEIRLGGAMTRGYGLFQPRSGSCQIRRIPLCKKGTQCRHGFEVPRVRRPLQPDPRGAQIRRIRPC